MEWTYTVPFSYHDPAEITSTLKEAGFRAVEISHFPMLGHSRTAREVARGFILGNPLSIELTQRGADPGSIVDQLTGLLSVRFGDHPLECRMRALVVEAN